MHAWHLLGTWTLNKFGVFKSSPYCSEEMETWDLRASVGGHTAEISTQGPLMISHTGVRQKRK